MGWGARDEGWGRVGAASLLPGLRFCRRWVQALALWEPPSSWGGGFPWLCFALRGGGGRGKAAARCPLAPPAPLTAPTEPPPVSKASRGKGGLRPPHHCAWPKAWAVEHVRLFFPPRFSPKCVFLFFFCSPFVFEPSHFIQQ